LLIEEGNRRGLVAFEMKFWLEWHIL
jgi:hypothetical protein